MQTDINNLDSTHYEIRHSVVILIAKLMLVELIITSLHMLMTEVIFSHSLHDKILGSLSGQVWELLIFHIITTIAILYFVLQRATTYYIINDKEIVYETGIISRKRNSYDLFWIQQIDSVQWFWWRIFTYGDIILENSLIASKIYLKNIPKPDYHAKLIKIIRHKNMRSKIPEEMISIKK